MDVRLRAEKVNVNVFASVCMRTATFVDGIVLVHTLHVRFCFVSKLSSLNFAREIDVIQTTC